MPRYPLTGSQSSRRGSGRPVPYSAINAQLPIPPSSLSQSQSSQSRSQTSTTQRSLSSLSNPSPSSSLTVTAQSSALPPPPAYTVEPPLSPHQQQVLNRVLAGANLFITGPAGTGKSVLIRTIIRQFRKREEESGEVLPELPVPQSRNRSQSVSQRKGIKFSRLAVTASTGKAAENIGGGTVHSWAGIGFGQGYRRALLKKVQDKPAAECRWIETRLLIIDEISMIDGRLFMLLDYIGRQIRQTERPFGGIQLVVCGDFLQLPPVKKENEEILDENRNTPDFAFQTSEWAEMFPIGQTVCLREVFRQVDVEFAKLLEDIRKGRATAETVREIAKLDRAVKYDDGIEPTALFGTRRQVEDLNLRKLDALCSATFRYRSIDLPGIDIDGEKLTAKKARIELDEKTIWPEHLVLKVGAQVMLLTNVSEHRLVNGSKGRVVAFQSYEDANRAGTSIVGESRSGDDETWPLVEFIAPPHSSDPTLRRFLVVRSKREVVNANLTIKATRIQVPLMLAWGMTIHKAQGQTIDRLKIDFSNIFARDLRADLLGAVQGSTPINFGSIAFSARSSVGATSDRQVGGKYRGWVMGWIFHLGSMIISA